MKFKKMKKFEKEKKKSMVLENLFIFFFKFMVLFEK